MPRRSIEQLLAQAQVALPDNNTGLISPAAVRTMFTDFLDTMEPAYGGLLITSRAQALTQTPAVLVFQTVIVAQPPEWATVDPATGAIQRTRDAPLVVTRVTVNGDVEGASNVEVTCVLSRNGVATDWRETVSTRGSGNLSTFAFVAIDSSDSDPSIYTLMVHTPTSGGNFTFSNFTFLCENIPVRSFTPVLVQGAPA